MSPMIYYETIKTHREDLLREAENERLIKVAQLGQPTLTGRFQLIVGELLIKTGGRLQIFSDTREEGLPGS